MLIQSTTDAPSSQPLFPLERLIADVLRDTLLRDHRTFDLIVWSPAGGEWRTVHGCLNPADVAALVLDPERVVGSRHRHHTRLIVADIDAKPGRSPSRYWSPAGPLASPGVQRFIAAAEAVGCGYAVFRTPSGGWHVWILLPEAVHHSIAAHMGLELAQRAGVEVGAGQFELFPTPTVYSEAAAPWHRPRSQAFRLPGQQGGATWIGSTVGWCSEPETAWAEVAAALELADGCTTPAWADLLACAAARRRRSSHRPGRRQLRRSGGPHGVAWTGPHQSNDNLGRLANALYQPGDDRESFGARIAAAAKQCPGWHQYASTDTKRHLDARARDWAASCISKPPRATARKLSSDSGRNNRLHREAVTTVIDGAERIAREHGEAALHWTERTAAAALGMARNTFRKLKALFLSRLTAAVYAIPVVGSHPCPKGLHRTLPAISPAVLAVHPIEDQSLHPVPISRMASNRLPPLQPPPLPIKPAGLSSPRREHERLELARWLGLVVAVPDVSV